MSDNRNRKRSNSTTEFFLNFMKQEKEEGKTVNKNRQNLENVSKTSFHFFGGLFNALNKMMDRMLLGKYSVMILSFILTIVLFFAFSGGDMINSTTSGAKIPNVPVNIEGLKEGYVVSGIPDSVTVGLIGPSLDIYTQQLTKNYEVYVDLSDYSKGSYNVSLKSRNFSDDLTVMILPETCNIRISPKVTRTFNLGYEIENEDDINEYAVTVEKLSRNKVEVSASKSVLDSIDSVVAIVNVDSSEAFTQTCDIKAYDIDHKEVECTIKPDKVDVTCRVDTYSKEVTIKPVFKGKLKTGYKLSNYKLSPSTVTIFGQKEDIVDITTISVDVNINNLSGSTNLTGLKLNKDDSITKISTEEVNIEMTIEKDGK